MVKRIENGFGIVVGMGIDGIKLRMNASWNLNSFLIFEVN